MAVQSSYEQTHIVAQESGEHHHTHTHTLEVCVVFNKTLCGSGRCLPTPASERRMVRTHTHIE